MSLRFRLWRWSGKKAAGSVDSSFEGGRCAGLGRWLPRTDSFMLFLGLGCTLSGKLIVLIRHRPEFLFAPAVQALVPDVLFFSLVALLIRCLFILKPSRSVGRIALLIATVVLAWSVTDMFWMLQSGVQLQPGLVVIVFRDLRGLFPYLQTYIAESIVAFIGVVLGVLCVVSFLVWKFVRPGKIPAVRQEHYRLAAAKLVLVMVLLLSALVVNSVTQLGFAGEVVGFSGHWHAVVYSTVGRFKNAYSNIYTRNIPAAGDRRVAVPDVEASEMPNVVLVLLESVSYQATNLCDEQIDTMPYLAKLAGEGVEFEKTRVPVSHTTKAYWATLTGSIPVIRADYVEAIPADEPYEGLPSILKRAGYRSAFFEMSRGNFECAPGFFRNLDFDWAWFRENLEDKSASLSYFGGDDFRMLEPAMEWLGEDSSPGLLVMITSISHEPYNVPAWYGKPKEDVDEKYLQSLRCTDYFIEKLCGELRDRGFGENTLLCVMGDHGTTFRSEVDFARWRPYEEVIRVPWVIHWPGHVEAGRKIDWPCSQLDVTPTILSLLGFDISRAGFEGRDAFVEGDADRRMYFSSWYSDSPIGYVEGDRKVVYWPYVDKVFEYDLGADPGEDRPLRVEGELAERAKREILEWQNTSQMVIDPRRQTKDFVYEHWRTISAGRSGWAYYLKD